MNDAGVLWKSDDGQVFVMEDQDDPYGARVIVRFEYEEEPAYLPVSLDTVADVRKALDVAEDALNASLDLGTPERSQAPVRRPRGLESLFVRVQRCPVNSAANVLEVPCNEVLTEGRCPMHGQVA